MNYKEFAELAAKYDPKEFVVMAFPCNQFGFQEPGTPEQIKEFAQKKGFQGLLMNKINVNGKDSSPVFQFLKVASGDTGVITWNFAKFIVRKDGTVQGRYGPRTNPLSLVPHIEECLKQ